MSDLVLDASALVDALLGDAKARRLRDRLGTAVCHAPHLIDVEVGNVLRRQERAARIDADQARSGLRLAQAFVDHRYPHTGNLFELAWPLRQRMSMYDAVYVALASWLDVPLLTADGRLARARPPCRVELV